MIIPSNKNKEKTIMSVLIIILFLNNFWRESVKWESSGNWFLKSFILLNKQINFVKNILFFAIKINIATKLNEIKQAIKDSIENETKSVSVTTMEFASKSWNLCA